jgi:hypothetical protein
VIGVEVAAAGHGAGEHDQARCRREQDAAQPPPAPLAARPRQLGDQGGLAIPGMTPVA